MNVVSIAHAQEVAGQTTGAGPVGEWAFIAFGTVLAVLAIVMIFKQFDVTSGHAIVLGVAVGVACLPYIANFEWTGDGFKFTTKSEGSQLAAQLGALTKQEAEIRANLQDMGEALKAATARIAVLEQTGRHADSEGAPSPAVPGEERFNPAFFDDLITNNKAAIRLTEQRLNEIDDLQRQLQTAR